MAPVEGVEKSTDICIHSPGDIQLPTLLTQLVERLVLTVPLPEAMGTRMKVRLEDGFQDHHHRPLDNRVLKAGFPYGRFLPSSFSIHTRSTGGATYRLSRSLSCSSRRFSSRFSAYCCAVTRSEERRVGKECRSRWS